MAKKEKAKKKRGLFGWIFLIIWTPIKWILKLVWKILKWIIKAPVRWVGSLLIFALIVILAIILITA